MSDYESKGLVKYTSRDYLSIMDDYWTVVPTLTEVWKPEADSDPGVVLGKFLASVGDMLGINLDLQANEVYGPSVTQRKNAEKVFGLIGYDLGFYSAAKTEVTITNNSGSGLSLDFGFNGANFSTLNAYTDITNASRVITYNILPMTNKYGYSDCTLLRDGDQFEGWMEFEMTVVTDEKGYTTYLYERISGDILYTHEEILRRKMPEHDVYYVAKWESIPMEAYFVE